MSMRVILPWQFPRIIVVLSLCWMDVNFVYGNNEETLSIQFIIAWSD